MRHLTETNPADTEPADVSSRSAAKPAAIVSSHAELGLSLLFFNQALFCHGINS
jgi:hypothetical protein